MELVPRTTPPTGEGQKNLIRNGFAGWSQTVGDRETVSITKWTGERRLKIHGSTSGHLYLDVSPDADMAGHLPRLDIEILNRVQELWVHVSSSVRIRIRFVNELPMDAALIALGNEASATIDVTAHFSKISARECAVMIEGTSTGTPADVVLQDASMTGRNQAVSSLTCIGDCSAVHGGVSNNVTIRGETTLLRFAGEVDGAIDSESPGNQILFIGSSECAAIANITARVASKFSLRIRDHARSVKFFGPGIVYFVRHAQVETVQFPRDADDAPILSGGRYLQLSNLSGHIFLGELESATIGGSVDSPIDRPLFVSGLGEDFNVSDLTLTRFVTPVGDHGGTVLSALRDQALHIEPLARPDLYLHGNHQSLTARWQHFEDLAEVASQRGAPASLQTKLAHIAYDARRRSLPTPSIERGVLRAYSFIGYGERFIPCAIAWAVAALVAGFVTMPGHAFDPTWPNITATVTHYLHWLISPLRLFDLRGAVANDQFSKGLDIAWVTLLRSFVAIPFVTGVLTARKFVKRPSAS